MTNLTTARHPPSRAYIGGMTTFAGVMDFTGPQPFNVEIRAEDVPCQPVRMPVLGEAVPVVAQEISPDSDLYPPRGRGVVGPDKRRRVWE